ncbi:hypothetical protein HOT99_gp254 [Caulobacter phage CcrBL10]|uniref:Uncharacterized protein n=1 Tax=Caulobacter phage CcrBL10 TaxID=2283269 RepID=A0A385E982_9CAUD|nr:hypothetical protein HOT99_gp254 [Caulobacter phage CcrBL10]AXQ68363.1 hypothetical protein CcrBL10_gp159c [Caulobacter phage CcrBL10]
MSKYTRLPVTVDAVQYTFQRLEDLPEWLTKHSAYTAMGTMSVGKDAVGKLLVPINGQIASATQDDYIVRIPRGENDYEMLILKPAAFEADYAAVDVPADVEPVQVETPAAPMVDEPQASPTTGAKGKAKTTAEPETEAPTPEA